MSDGRKETATSDIVQRLRMHPSLVSAASNAMVTMDDAADEIERLMAENALLRAHLREDTLLRLAVENGWEHEPNNPRGVWCCEEHERAFRNGTLFGNGS